MTKHDYPVPTASPFVDFRQYIPLILAAIHYELQPDSVWSDTDRATAQDYIQELIRWFIEWNDTDVPISTTIESFVHWHITAQNNVGNAVALTINTGQMMNHYGLQSAAAINDEWFGQDFWLKGGHSYVCDIYGLKASGAGIVTIEARDVSDGSLVATVTQDLYNATTVLNFKFQLGFTLTADRHIRLKGKVASKNASSAGYGCPLTAIFVRH